MREYFKNFFNRIRKDVKDYWIPVVCYFIYYLITLTLFRASCPAVFITGFPCPGCGMTRAAFAIVGFDFAKAYEINPVSFAIVIFVALFFFFRYFLGKTPKIFKTLFIILCVMLFARYLYGMINWYPKRIPYVYNKNSLLYHLILHKYF